MKSLVKRLREKSLITIVSCSTITSHFKHFPNYKLCYTVCPKNTLFFARTLNA